MWPLYLGFRSFYLNLLIKGSEAQKQRLHEFLWMLWFDEKSISNVSTYRTYTKKKQIGIRTRMGLNKRNLCFFPFTIVPSRAIWMLHVSGNDKAWIWNHYTHTYIHNNSEKGEEFWLENNTFEREWDIQT